MTITIEVNEYGDTIKVTTFDSGHVIREIYNPVVEQNE